ncbi:DUF5074 domain-containing protein [Flavobacterium sp.]|uniref:DUF5074 domain-containing protein n=1 Tax=Flavobacterium sp. TaxID=239 RepID=UPI00120365DA|nr:DUF5074 domain-containing protein [Flavobacterium sp.]RZJ71376.1 MAG: T9SS type A sorting domain-containing protein [Flavobacterium sp.]
MKHIYTFFAMLFGLISVAADAQSFDNGIFVLNEGGAGSNNASVSYIPNSGSLQNNIFASANPSAGSLGDTAQSLTFYGNYAYIVLNISNTIKIVDRMTFELVATVSTGLNNPRYMAFVDGKGFITNWGSGANANDDYLAVLDLETNIVENTIPLAEGAERIAAINNQLYILHQGGYGFGNSVSIVNPQTETLTTSIAVGDVPNSYVVDNGFLYVLCGGKPSWSGTQTSGGLYKIDLSDNEVEESLTWNGMNPANLQSSGNGSIFFTNDANVYKGEISSLGLNAPAIIALGEQGVYGIYGLNFIDGKLYVADAGNYVSPGTAFVYDANGTAVTNYVVGVIPNGFYKAEPNLSVPNPTRKLALFAYPNPTSDKFFVNSEEVVPVSLFDLTGRKVLEQNASNQLGIDVTSLQSGQYLAQIATQKGVVTTKILVK